MKFSLLPLLPFVLALAAVTGAPSVGTALLLIGLGGLFVAPVAEPVVAPTVARLRDVSRPRAPDAFVLRRAA